MAPFLRVLLNLYSVEGALLIISAVASHIIACGLLLRPTPFYTGKRNKASYESDCSSTEEQGPLVDSLTRDSDQFDRLYSSDPNIVLKKGHFQQVDCPKRRTSNEVVSVFQPNDSKECSLNFERQGSAVVNSTIGKERIFNIKIFKNTSYLRLLFAYVHYWLFRHFSPTRLFTCICNGTRNRQNRCRLAYNHQQLCGLIRTNYHRLDLRQKTDQAYLFDCHQYGC